MNTKKLLSILIAILFILTMAGTVLAADNPTPQQDYKDIYEYYAYMDIETATPELRESILEARKVVAGRTEWVADGLDGYIEDGTTGEIIRVLPHFSEAFPGWDPPIYDELIGKPGYYSDDSIFHWAPFSVEKEYTYNESSKHSFNTSKLILNGTKDGVLGINDWIYLSSGSAYLQNPTNTMSQPFVDFVVNTETMGTSIRTCATSLTSSQTCNLGYSNYNTGASYGYATYLYPSQYFAIYGLYNNVHLAVRGSTYSVPGWGYFRLEGANRTPFIKI